MVLIEPERALVHAPLSPRLGFALDNAQEVVEHLSQLKTSLENTLGEEERLKQQAHSVQRLAKVDGRTDHAHRNILFGTNDALVVHVYVISSSAWQCHEPRTLSTPYSTRFGIG